MTYTSFQIINLEGRILFCNKSSEFILGFPANTIIGTSILDKVVEEDKSSTQEAFISVRQLGKIYNFENRILSKDNTEIYLCWSFIWDEQTKDTIVIGRNISELKNNERISF
ncbi:PAS domain-containing protein [Sediminibacterium sp. C3]|uniref:PAS domain-containing protein n=1 Tax=Sediminibacterium sp. C3 TaxID=1267211 RepID=UPI0009DF291E